MKFAINVVILFILFVPLDSFTQQTRTVTKLEPAKSTQINPRPANSENYIQVTPSPFYEVCVIRIIPPSNEPISVDIYDNKGNHIKSLINGESIESPLTIIWTGNDENGNPLPDGIYFVSVNISGKTTTKKIVKKKSMN